MKLRLTPRAVQDLEHIAEYIRGRSPVGAEHVRAAIIDGLHKIALFPGTGRRQSVGGVRKAITRKYPYLVYYTVDATAGEVVVLAIQHPAREREDTDA